MCSAGSASRRSDSRRRRGRQTKTQPLPLMAPQHFLDQPAEERGFFQRFGFVLGLGALLVVGGVIFIGQSLAKASTAPHKMPEVTMVKILAAPPPPPPPPPQPKLVEEKMVEQMPVDADEAKPDDSAPAPS